ncbi:unnamed protein product, partial [Amoebophrya sp. A25]
LEFLSREFSTSELANVLSSEGAKCTIANVHSERSVKCESAVAALVKCRGEYRYNSSENKANKNSSSTS